MSDPHENAQVNGAEALRIHAADWLMQQRTADGWTEADQAKLDAWLAESPAHLLAYWRLEAAWSRTDRLAALRPNKETKVLSSQSKSIFPFLARAVAAFVGLGIVGAVFLRQPVEPQGREFATSVGGHETILLADGSLIELNTDSTVHVLDKGDIRKVTLNKGEAYFQVVHNEGKPFVVVAGNRRIVDLGTKFLVRQDASSLKVAVFEGLIRFEPGQSHGTRDGKPVTLSAGETLVATAKNVGITRATSQEVTEALGWRHGLLVFYRKPLAAAAAEFNRYNNQQIVIAGIELGRMPVTGTLSATDPDQFIRMAQNLFELHVERSDGKILISR
jgi:transmembrane sensor